jgi:hypothetical protein
LPSSPARPAINAIATGILLDTLVVRTFVTPALVMLIDRKRPRRPADEAPAAIDPSELHVAGR